MTTSSSPTSITRQNASSRQQHPILQRFGPANFRASKTCQILSRDNRTTFSSSPNHRARRAKGARASERTSPHPRTLHPSPVHSSPLRRGAKRSRRPPRRVDSRDNSSRHPPSETQAVWDAGGRGGRRDERPRPKKTAREARPFRRGQALTSGTVLSCATLRSTT
jgi:hypothetical protein